MNLNDRTMYNLQYFGVKYTEEEMIGMRLTDGLYDENNKEYYIKYNNDDRLATSIPFIMHTADQMAAIYENKRWEAEMNPVKSTRKPTTGRPKKGDLSETFASNDVKPTSVFDAFKDIVED